MQALSLSHPYRNLTLAPVDPTKLNLAGAAGGENQKWQWADDLAVMTPGQLFILQLSGLPKSAGQTLVLEIPEQPVSFDGSNQAFEMLAINQLPAKRPVTQILDRSGKVMKILDLKGIFSFVAIVAPKEHDLQAELGFDPEQLNWPKEQSQDFLRNLRSMLLNEPDDWQLASYSYRVL